MAKHRDQKETPGRPKKARRGFTDMQEKVPYVTTVLELHLELVEYRVGIVIHRRGGVAGLEEIIGVKVAENNRVGQVVHDLNVGTKVEFPSDVVVLGGHVGVRRSSSAVAKPRTP